MNQIGQLDLRKLKGVSHISVQGVQGIFIPFDANHIYSGEKGDYMNFEIWDKQQPKQFGNKIHTHDVKLSGLSKEQKSRMSKEQIIEETPYFGSLFVFAQSQQPMMPQGYPQQGYAPYGQPMMQPQGFVPQQQGFVPQQQVFTPQSMPMQQVAPVAPQAPQYQAPQTRNDISNDPF